MSTEHVSQVNLIENGPVVVVGTIDLHHPDGTVERRERRITGEVGAGDFLQNWNQTRERG